MNREVMSAISVFQGISLHAQVQFHAKYMYPLFDSTSDRESTFSYVILTQIAQKNACSKSFICIWQVYILSTKLNFSTDCIK